MDILRSFCREVFFKSGPFDLRGFLHLPPNPCAPVVIGSHGFASTSESPKQKELARRCLENKIGFFRFDHRGCGRSCGIFSEVTSLDGRCQDLEAAIETVMKITRGKAELGLFGSSMGGSVVLRTAGGLKNNFIRSVITLAAPVRGDSIIVGQKDMDDLPESFYEENLNFDISSHVKSVGSILVYHGDMDETVDPESAREIYRLAGEPKKIIIQSGGDHRLSEPCHIRNFMNESVKWYQSCLSVNGS